MLAIDQTQLAPTHQLNSDLTSVLQLIVLQSSIADILIVHEHVDTPKSHFQSILQTVQSHDLTPSKRRLPIRLLACHTQFDPMPAVPISLARPTLIVTFVNATKRNANALDWLHKHIFDYYAHTQLLVMPSDVPTTMSNMHAPNIQLRFPPGAAIFGIAYDIDIRAITRDMIYWCSVEEFLQPNVRLPAINPSDALDLFPFSMHQRLDILRTTVIPLYGIEYAFLTINRTVPRNFTYQRLFEQYLQQQFVMKFVFLGVIANVKRSDIGGGGVDVVPMLSWSARIMQSSKYLRPEIEYDTSKLGRVRYMLLVPNWWRYCGGGGDVACQDTANGSQSNYMLLFFICAVLFASFLVLRLATSASVRRNSPHRGADRTLVVVDSWARCLGVSMKPAEHHSEESVGLLVSVWGLMNGLTMTSVLLDILMNSGVVPVYRTPSDVWSGSSLMIKYDDSRIAANFKYTFLGLTFRE